MDVEQTDEQVDGQKRCVLALLMRNHVLEVEPTVQRSRMSTESGKNINWGQKITSSIYRKPKEIEPWLLPNRLDKKRRYCLISGNDRTASSAEACRFVAIGIVSLVTIDVICIVVRAQCVETFFRRRFIFIVQGAWTIHLV